MRGTRSRDASDALLLGLGVPPGSGTNGAWADSTLRPRLRTRLSGRTRISGSVRMAGRLSSRSWIDPVASGANVKAVQWMLGHASAAMTLDVHADLFEDDLDGVADRMDEAISRAAEDSLRTGPVTALLVVAPASL